MSEGEASPEHDSLSSLYRPGQMRRRLDQMLEMNRRYGQPFGLVVFAIEGPGIREGSGGGGTETVLAIVGAALRESIRLVDEVFRLEEDALCVLAPNQTTVEGVQMAERLLRMLDELEQGGGLSITVSPALSPVQSTAARRSASCTAPIRRCGGRGPSASRSASALLQDR